MRSFTLVCFSTAALALGSTIALCAKDSAMPTTEPAATQEHKPASTKPSKWGFAPYNQLSNVTDDQKAKINDIHRKANADRKAIDDKEDEDVTALLTDDQKAELEQMKADKKAKAAEKRDEKKKDKDTSGKGT